MDPSGPIPLQLLFFPGPNAMAEQTLDMSALTWFSQSANGKVHVDVGLMAGVTKDLCQAHPFLRPSTVQSAVLR